VFGKVIILEERTKNERQEVNVLCFLGLYGLGDKNVEYGLEKDCCSFYLCFPLFFLCQLTQT